MGDTKKTEQNAPLIQLNWPVQMTGHSVVEIGLSGGLDSVALLNLLAAARETHSLELSAVHVHHGLSANADAWAEHCRALCAARQIPLRIERVKVSPQGDGIESAARRARYAIYRQSSAQTVALAQHLDDQSETMLLQTLRGGGPHALAAMPQWRQLTDRIALWRPLLHVTREQLAAYAQAHALVWVDDESNDDQRYRRNWLRHSIMPLLAAQMPDYRQSLQRCARQMADAAAMLDELAAGDLQQAVQNDRLQINTLTSLSEPRQRQLLLRWAEQQSLGTPAPGSVEDFRRQLLHAKADRLPTWALPHGNAHRYRDQLWPDRHAHYAMPTVALHDFDKLDLPDWGGALSWQRAARGLPDDILAQGLTLQSAPPGARLTIASGRKPFKNLFQEHAIPPFLRGRWPVVCTADGRIAALPSIATASDLSVEGGWLPVWHIACHQ